MENSGNSRGENSGAGQENQAEELDPGHDEKAKESSCHAVRPEKGQKLKLLKFDIKEGETSPPKRYTSGSMILAMENAGQLIEDEGPAGPDQGKRHRNERHPGGDLKKLFNIKYLALAKKTQVITPTLLGEIVFDVSPGVHAAAPESGTHGKLGKGPHLRGGGTITPDEYMEKLERFVTPRTNGVKQTNNAYMLRPYFDAAAPVL